MALTSRPVRAVLLDISGVLKNCVDEKDVAIEGSVEAVKRLKSSQIPLRFCTNETTTTRAKLVSRLQTIGFDIKEEEVYPPAPAVCRILQQRGLRPHLLIHPGSRLRIGAISIVALRGEAPEETLHRCGMTLMMLTELVPDFQQIDQKDPNCVVIGDATDTFSYANLNTAFQTLIAMEKPVLISMGQGKYYKENNSLVLDVGSYKAALEYACGVTAEVVGKPSKAFFQSVLDSMGAAPQDTVMVGDDVENDVGGAQRCGMRGVLVRTGKYRPSDEQHPSVTPDLIAHNLAAAVDELLKAVPQSLLG